MEPLTYVKICEEEDGDDVIELPCEDNNTLLLSTLTAQFPGSTGLKYKSESGGVRGVRCTEGAFFAPPQGWDAFSFYCVFPKADNKRKCDEGSDNPIAKTKKLDDRKCTDLVVLGMAWKTDEAALRSYFGKYGEVVMAQVKRNPSTGQSKGYGFLRFADMAGQIMCLAEKHCIDGRWCEVKVPNSKAEGDRQEVCNKIFVGNINEEMTTEIIQDHFGKYGQVREVFIPKPFRSFAFVTFASPEPVPELLRRDHVIEGVSVRVGTAVPKLAPINNSGGGGGGLMGDNMGNNARFGGGMNQGFNQGGQFTGMGMRGMQNQQQQQQQQQPFGGWQYNPGYNNNMMVPQGNQRNNNAAADMSQNTAALAALNMLNNPSVVAAIMSVAGQAANGRHNQK